MSRRKPKRFKTRKDFVVFTPSSEDVTLAHTRSCKLGIIPGSSPMHRMAGFLGEVAVNKYLPRSKYVGDKVYTYDVTYRRYRVEVKSKVCSTAPEPHYNAFVNGRPGMVPEADIFFFTRVRKDFQRVYLVGWLPAPTFLDEAQFVMGGETSPGGYTYKLSGLNIAISELSPPKDFKTIRAC